jgi:hypothetical protein
VKAAVTGARSPTESAGTVQLGLGGTFEGTNLFASEDLVMSFLTQRLGPPDDIFDRGMCEGGGAADRRVTWGNLTVLFVDDGAAYLEAQHPRDERRRTDFGLWEYWLIKTGTDVQGMQTTEGVGLVPRWMTSPRPTPTLRSARTTGAPMRSCFRSDGVYQRSWTVTLC